MSETMRYRITHRTRYEYSEPVAICQNQLRMMPRTIGSATYSTECHHAHACISPEPDVFVRHEDYFGNQVISFAIESLHRDLTVDVRSEVTVRQDELPTLDEPDAWEDIRDRVAEGKDADWLEVQEYSFDSPRIRCSPRLAEFAKPSFTQGRPIIDAAIDLTRRIHAEFKYDTSATNVDTPIEEAFDKRAGVCQDFAHVQIACLRSIGLPTRYVSGYLRTHSPPGSSRLVGADESHAWVSLYAGQRYGWIDLDPTNACLSDTNHIPICVGRDYSEVSPMRGVVLGGGSTNLRVNVDVEAIESSAL